MAHQEYDRRIEPRALTAALIEIVDEYNDKSTCVLEDLSMSGARIPSDIPLRVGVQLTVRAGSITHRASVRHCQPAMDGFDVGVEFINGSWPAPIEFPIHWIRADRD